MRTLVLALLLAACRTDEPKAPSGTGDTGTATGDDADGDGTPSANDCDDADASVHPGAEEACNGVDDDCDGEIDEGVRTTFFLDADGDGHGDAVAMQAYIDQLPVAAFLVVILAHLGQAGVGGWVAARVAGSHPRRLAMVVAGLTLAGGLVIALQLSAPAWTYIEMPLYLVVGWVAGTLELRRRQAAGQ